MLLEGVNLMVVGMTTVFSFLALLVIVLEVSARTFQRGTAAEAQPATAAMTPRGVSPVRGSEEIAVVLAAVEAHRRR